MMLAWSFPVSFDRPGWLWLLLLIPLMAAISARSLAGLDRSRRIVAVSLRGLVIIALAIALAQIHYVKRNDHVAVMFVLDRSRSVPQDRREAAERYVREVAKAAAPDDRLGIIGFDGQPEVDLITSKGGADIYGFGMAVEPDRTNIAGGVRMAMAAFPEGYARRIVLVTDGNENVGNLVEEVEAAAANGIAIDVIPIEYQHDHEILVDRITVPAHANRETKVPVRIMVKSRKTTRARLTLYHNGAEVPLADPIIQIKGGMEPNPFTVPIELSGGGVHRFEAHVTPLAPGDDVVPENNRATAFTFVEDQGRVLILTQAGRDDDQVLYEALRREKVDVDIRSIDDVQVDLLGLQEYGAVVLANIPADRFNAEQHKALASYVRDFGGGLVMTGGDESFGAGGWIGKPVEEVSPVRFEIRQKQIIPRGALAIIMHSCEIPRGNYWGEQVAIAAVDTISSLDYLGVICYSYGVNGYNWDVPLAPATDKDSVKRKIQQMQIGDMPDFGTTMDMAVKGLMSKKDAAQRHVIIISDGDPSGPSDATIKAMIDNRITCSTVSIGWGMHVSEPTLKDIAQRTKGKYYKADNPKGLPQIFVKEARVVRRSLIDDHRFQPRMPFGFAQTTQGISDGDLPPLDGLVLTEAKPDCIMPIIRKSSDGTDPVFAHWNFEMGKMAVFTSGWWTKWGTEWSGWPKFGKFWAQVLRWASRQEASADFDVMTRIEGNKGHVIVEALNKDDSYLNFLRIEGRLLTPSADMKKLFLAQTGPGRYEAGFDVDEHGNYLINLQYNDAGGQSGMIRTGVSMPYSPEFREQGINLSLLDKVVERTGGRMLRMDAKADRVFERNLPPAIARQPIWRWFVTWLLLPLFLLDVAGRRLASALAMSIYVEAAILVMACAIMYAARAGLAGYVGAMVLAEVVGWIIRYRYLVPTIGFFTSSATALVRIGQRSTASLTQLKGVREKVRDEMETRASAGAEQSSARGAGTRIRDSGTVPLEPLADRKARFDVGDEAGAKPAAELTESLGAGAAKPVEPGIGPRGEPLEKGKTSQGDMASRLRKAKQRAKEQMDGRSKDKENES